jgi:ABC-type glycerol-3-phosphate transport system permease component
MKNLFSSCLVKWFARIIWAVITLSFPLTLLWLSIHEPGVNLETATSFNFSFNAFSRLLFSTEGIARQFRSGLVLSSLYSLTSATIATVIAIGFVVIFVKTPARRATSLAFMLLGFVLLPQTFLILASLKIARFLGISTANPILISVMISTGLIPIACWAGYILIGEDTKRLLHLSAIDGLKISRALDVLLQAHAVAFGQIFLLCFTLGIGNFLIPFALGDNSTYTALVYIQSFSSNLGRDWATVAAGGIILLFPVIIVSIVSGIAVKRLL